MAIARNSKQTVVIHFGAASAAATSSGLRLDVVDLYCRWVSRHSRRVFVLLPERARAEAEPVLAELSYVTPVWYNGDGVSAVAKPPRRGDAVWVINGGRLPIVDWNTAGTSHRRSRSDVLVYGRSNSAGNAQYPESVVVGEGGQVVKFKRHYCDSPEFTDLWDGEASFLAVSGEHSRAVVNHVIARGWGLKSIGALTRRVSVQWSLAPCVLSEFATSSACTILGGHEKSFERQSGEARTGGDPESSAAPSRFAEAPSTGSNGKHHGAGAAGTLRVPQHGNGNGKHAAPALRVGARNGAPSRFAPAVSDVRSNGNGRAAPTAQPGCTTFRECGYRVMKRTLDISVAVMGLLLLSPLLLLVALIIKCTSRGPVLFAHKRQGLAGKEFGCLKFRSMRVGADELQAELREHNEVDGPQFKMDRDPRITRFGDWIRGNNIDELPQLINVLLGQMSLVGPRPSPDKENQFCPAWRRTRLSVKPGITGLWQVLRMRDEEQSDFQEWIYYDMEYAHHRSFRLDMELLLYTPASVFASRFVDALARSLHRRGICMHSARLGQEQRLAG